MAKENEIERINQTALIPYDKVRFPTGASCGIARHPESDIPAVTITFNFDDEPGAASVAAMLNEVVKIAKGH